MKVIDNFLPSYQFKILERMMRSTEFPWYYNDGILKTHEPHQYQFTHLFYYKGDKNFSSEFLPLLDSGINKLGLTRLWRIKANLNPRTLFHRKAGYHIDFEDIMKAVYYVNTTNGWTEFKKVCRVKSVANRVVIFDSNLEHSGVTCTDEKRRMVINFNYEV